MELQTSYQEAIKFATTKHLEQKQLVPGTELPYVVHLSNVAMEILVAGLQTDKFETGFAVQVALLHDTLEDTSTTRKELETRFGKEVAQAVSALSKNLKLPKAKQMADSLKRIKKLRPEVWAVKLADRITNLQSPPPHWDQWKINKYCDEAILILATLRKGNDYLAGRLERMIMEYSKMYVRAIYRKDWTCLLEAGGEGGSIQLVQINDYFLFSTDETTLMEFVPELTLEELKSESDVFTTFEDALAGMLDKHPIFELFPLSVHPDYRMKVMDYYREFCSRRDHQEYRRFNDWEELLQGKVNGK
ncbi:MAG: HD domain-containing protein [Prolixibacteraceae bacterium]